MSPLAKICLPIFVGFLIFALWPGRQSLISGLEYANYSNPGPCQADSNNRGYCGVINIKNQLHFGGGFYFVEQQFLSPSKPLRLDGLTYQLERQAQLIPEEFNTLLALGFAILAATLTVVIEKKFIPTVTPTWYKQKKNSKKK